VKVGHDSHLRAHAGRISLPIYPVKQTISEPVSASQKCHVQKYTAIVWFRRVDPGSCHDRSHRKHAFRRSDGWVLMVRV
jgi:hypothetical protein